MSDETRLQAMSLLQNEFQLNTCNEVKNKWIIGGRIPEQFQERTVHLFQQLLQHQHNRLREMKVHF